MGRIDDGADGFEIVLRDNEGNALAVGSSFDIVARDEDGRELESQIEHFFQWHPQGTFDDLLAYVGDFSPFDPRDVRAMVHHLAGPVRWRYLRIAPQEPRGPRPNPAARYREMFAAWPSTA